jgi:hypothetical protein
MPYINEHVRRDPISTYNKKDLFRGMFHGDIPYLTNFHSDFPTDSKYM